MKHTVKVRIGDPSMDGHGYNETFEYKSNKTQKEIAEAYFKSCELVGVSFHRAYDIEKDCRIFVEHGDTIISKNAYKKLSSHLEMQAEQSYGYHLMTDEMMNLIFNFIKLSLPDWKYKEFHTPKGETLDDITGFWGYGITGFDD